MLTYKSAESAEIEQDFRVVAGRGDSSKARGELFEQFRQYLSLVAYRELDPRLRRKVGASDLVQQTFLAAERGFGRFRGQTERELAAWLTRILKNRARREYRRFRRAAKRDVRRERALADFAGAAAMPRDVETPSRQLRAAEEADQLAAALSRLPDDYQTVIQLRNTEGKSFEEIGALTGRSAEASRKVWVRAIDRLRMALAGESHSQERD
ncbi:MAG TPA: sigma-70 family RNA polymerase sigma factor [Pirellulales bacterium]